VTDPTGPAADADVETLAFDDAFAELQRVVAGLEAGGASLEATIAQYERATALDLRCRRLLADAELRVQQLMARSGGAVATVDVNPDEAEEDPATIR